ncbi:MAG: DUF1284 domain-containing protein [Holosporaceae bacterium]|jgi:hypothetical protein|nr:DUF1284 domain-containing protein [Holosporaceae bacterium]
MVYLRPHHLVCLLSFQGNGYDDVFVKKLAQIVSTLKRNSDKKIITIVNNRSDDVCKFCPKNKSGVCEEQQEIVRLDVAFAKILDLGKGKVFSFDSLKEIIKNISAEEFKTVCGECRWFGICYNSLYQPL